ncbi:MAG: hypothetical protein H6567_01415 [Lewinellaceae bacterium]|nr:hypothetical protein [Lewinellaceae bacterium]
MIRNIIDDINEDDIVVISPLNWGMGHASRCIPLIKLLKEKAEKVIIVADGKSYALLALENPEVIQLRRLPLYYGSKSVIFNMIINIPSLMINYGLDRISAYKITERSKASVVISDNRFGFRAKRAINIYISHQINILHSNNFISKIAITIHKYVIHKFNKLWIPDTETHAISGNLSVVDGFKIPVKFIGPLTRIVQKNLPKNIDILIVLSGIEPQRSLFESILLNSLSDIDNFRIVLVRSTSKPFTHSVQENVQVYDIVETDRMNAFLNSAKVLISRSGYSTLMDIYDLDLKAIFVPTPGQTEQEYLAKITADGEKYFTLDQSEIKTSLIQLIKSQLQ